MARDSLAQRAADLAGALRDSRSVTDRNVVTYLRSRYSHGETDERALGRVGDEYADFPCRTRSQAIARTRRRLDELDLRYSDLGPATAAALRGEEWP